MATFERVGPRPHGQLAVDRPNVTMDRAVRHVQFTTDIPLRQIAAQELEHPELPLCQLGIFGQDAADLRWPLEGGQPLGQDPRIRAVLEDRSRIGYRSRGRLVLAHGPKHRRLAEQGVGQLDGLAKGPRQCDAVLDQRQRLLGPAAAPPAIPPPPAEPGRRPRPCRAPVRIRLPSRPAALLVNTAPLAGDQRSIGQR